jgi:four helix bundle protein
MRHNFRELKIWHKGIELSVEMHQLTRAFPAEEKFSLTSQIKRCSVSIPSNISEGSGRNSQKDFKHYLNIAYTSCLELETQLIISQKLNYLTEKKLAEFTDKLQELQKMIFSFSKGLTE